jgi:hypothetical protein
LHPSLICPTANSDPANAGYGKYRVQVDIMGNMYLGRNTMLFIIDGLWGGGPEETKAPRKWNMAPFNNDWSSSVFMSLDQVALESVCYDFIRTEYNGENQPETNPNWSGVDDYLHQAADESNWPEGIAYDPEQDGTVLSSLGVHEHWQNATSMAYTRNLNTGEGIELFRIPPVNTKIPTSLENEFTASGFKAAIHPNPFREMTSIRYTLERPAHITVAIYDMNGRLIQTLADRNEPAGERQLSWHPVNLESGYYIASFIVSGQQGRFSRTLKMYAR